MRGINDSASVHFWSTIRRTFSHADNGKEKRGWNCQGEEEEEEEEEKEKEKEEKEKEEEEKKEEGMMVRAGTID